PDVRATGAAGAICVLCAAEPHVGAGLANAAIVTGLARGLEPIPAAGDQAAAGAGYRAQVAGLDSAAVSVAAVASAVVSVVADLGVLLLAVPAHHRVAARPARRGTGVPVFDVGAVRGAAVPVAVVSVVADLVGIDGPVAAQLAG